MDANVGRVIQANWPVATRLHALTRTCCSPGNHATSETTVSHSEQADSDGFAERNDNLRLIIQRPRGMGESVVGCH